MSTRGKTDELWARWLDGGRLDASEQRALADALAADPELGNELLGDQRVDGALAALGRSAGDGNAFARRFAERVAAERDGRRFVSSMERRLVADPRARGQARDRRLWLLLPVAAAAALLVLALRTRAPVQQVVTGSDETAAPAEPSPPAGVPRRPAIARVESATGALLLDGGRKMEARPGAPLPAGWGVVTVGAQSRAVLAFDDHTTLTLDGDSALVQVSDGGGRGKEGFLARGRVTADVEPQPPGLPLVVTTPQAQATVVGTRFALTVGHGATRLDVTEGEVRMAPLARGEVTAVRAGQYAVISDAGRTAVRADLKGVALMLVGREPLQYDDTRIKQRLEELGYLVRVRGSGPPDPTVLQEVAVVLVSSSVFSLDLNTQYRDVPLPVIVWEPSLFDDFGMTGPEENKGCGVAAGDGEAVINLPTHPMAAGLDGTVTVITNGHDKHHLWVSYGTPGPGAASVASWPGRPGRSVLFAYEQGAAMPGLPAAPARRVGFFFYDDGRLHLTAAGWTLFDAAVAWAAGR